MQQEVSRREGANRERALGLGDLVKRRHEAGTKLHPRWDGPFVIRDMTDKNTYQLQTCNRYVLKHLYNGERLQRYVPSGTDKDLWFASTGLQKKENDELQRQSIQEQRCRKIAAVSESASK